MSANFSAFESGEAGDHLVSELRRLTGVESFDLALVLGSGWEEVASLGETLAVLDYRDWPCFPAGQVAGHGGQLIALRYACWNLLVFSGRFHCYQGLSAFQAAFPVRLSSALGCPRILLTCATGGVNANYQPGDFMLVDDHLNLLGDNPLRGLPGNTFVDLSGLYHKRLYDLLQRKRAESILLHRGVLAAMSGPSYETPAEIRFLKNAGADVVSMSTVPEAIMARYLGMQVAAVAFIANYAAGLTPASLSHQEVLDCSSQHAHLFSGLVTLLVETWQNMEAADSCSNIVR